jgi:rhodanese-related sulfurtransferase
MPYCARADSASISLPMKSPLILFLAALALCAGSLRAEDSKPAPAAATAAVEKNVTPDEAEKLLKKNPNIVILDVRTADEFKGGHIPGAKNLDIMSPDFATQLAALDKNKTYLVHCAAGSRSARACKAMDAQKFTSIYHLNEGFRAWVNAGKPVEK